MFFLHIGLPKTATSFWQHDIFNADPAFVLVHKRLGDHRTLCRAVRTFAQSQDATKRNEQRGQAALLKELLEETTALGRHLVVSDENISVTYEGFWNGRGAHPDTVAERLVEFCRSEAGIAEPIGVLIGTRRQAPWLASRYAQSAKNYANAGSRKAHSFNQKDFDARMVEIAESAVLPGPLAWLEHDRVHQTFCSAFGARNVQLLPLEKISVDPEPLARDLEKFLGCSDFIDRIAPRQLGEDERSTRRRNVLSRGENLWSMPGGKLVMSAQIEEYLDARFN